MNQEEPNHHDPGFLFSLNLMLIGGVLLLGLIVSANKLLNHFLKDYWEQSRGILASVGQMEAETFAITSSADLYLTWTAALFSLTGLIIVIRKLVIYWKV